ncbi:hypothetical protein CRUP_006026 [Coryphaenoides rupestris]|nr:hypothetical protein CRUP_006026 [Coryphaenoides rupestris]
MRTFCKTLFPVVEYAYCTIPTYPSGQIGFMLCSKNTVLSTVLPLQQWAYIARLVVEEARRHGPSKPWVGVRLFNGSHGVSERRERYRGRVVEEASEPFAVRVT